MAVADAQNRITAEVTAWPDVTAVPHRFGGTEYQLGSRELGHIHGDHFVDIPFPTKVRDEIVAAGDAGPHHILPDSGWITLYLERAEDVGRAVSLFRRSYDLAVRQRARREGASANSTL